SLTPTPLPRGEGIYSLLPGEERRQPVSLTPTPLPRGEGIYSLLPGREGFYNPSPSGRGVGVRDAFLSVPGRHAHYRLFNSSRTFSAASRRPSDTHFMSVSSG